MVAHQLHLSWFCDNAVVTTADVGSHAAWRNPTVDGEWWRIRHRPWDTPSRNWGSW
jgi:hypothetical protein